MQSFIGKNIGGFLAGKRRVAHRRKRRVSRRRKRRVARKDAKKRRRKEYTCGVSEDAQRKPSFRAHSKPMVYKQFSEKSTEDCEQFKEEESEGLHAKAQRRGGAKNTPAV